RHTRLQGDWSSDVCSSDLKEMIYLAVSTANQCGYCIASHTAGARKAGMTDAMLGELMAVVGMASETNALAAGHQVEIDAAFKPKIGRASCRERVEKWGVGG